MFFRIDFFTLFSIFGPQSFLFLHKASIPCHKKTNPSSQGFIVSNTHSIRGSLKTAVCQWQTEGDRLRTHPSRAQTHTALLRRRTWDGGAGSTISVSGVAGDL